MDGTADFYAANCLADLYRIPKLMAKMTTKNAKTILFASLIAVMILPFGGIESAEAKSTQDALKSEIKAIVTKILNMQDRIATVEAELEDATGDEQIELEAKLTRMEAKLDTLEQKLTAKVNSLSQLTSSTAQVPENLTPDSSTTRSAFERSTCNGLINDDNDCTSDMDVREATVSLIQPIDDYTTGPCPSGSPTTLSIKSS